MREVLTEDMAWMRRNLLIVGIIALGVSGMLLLIWFTASSTLESYDRMIASLMTAQVIADENSEGVREGGRAKHLVEGERQAYLTNDPSHNGVPLPPSRQERLAAEERVSEIHGTNEDKDNPGSKQDPGTCQDTPADAEYSDLCAQWNSVAAMRYGNRIAAENFRISSLAAIISGLAFFVTGMGIIIASLAARDASKAVKLMKAGMVPLLSVRPAGKSGNLGLINAGTGVAKNISLNVDGQTLDLRRRVLQAGENLRVPSIRDVHEGISFDIALRYSDASDDVLVRNESFCFNGGEWVQTS